MVDVPHRAVTPSRPWRIPRASVPGAGAIDPAVLRAAIGGDEAAFTAVFRAVDPVLRRYATVLVSHDADDVVGDAWLSIARDLRSFEGDVDGFRGWCVRIVRNRAVDQARWAGRRPATPSSHTDSLDRVAPDDTATDALDRVATRSAVALIASLPREQAEAVFLRTVVGLDGPATAAVLGKSANAVRVSTHRGLHRLRRALREQDGGAS